MNVDSTVQPIETVLKRLDGAHKSGAGWTAHCPAHEDRSPSLSIREGDDGRVLLRCFAGCTFDALCAALGLAQSDLFATEGEHAVERLEPAQRDRARTQPQGAGAFLPWRAQRLWDASLAEARADAVTDRNAEVFRYVRRRGLLEAWELCLFGTLHATEAFVHGLRHWGRSGHRLIVPLFDADGVLVNVQARCIVDHERKTLFPKGSRVKGTVFANAAALQLLRRTAAPGGPVIYAEGLTDFLALSIISAWPVFAAPGTPFAVDAISAWADGAFVLLAIDNDAAGERVRVPAARRLFEVGAERIVRVVWPEGCKDACDALQMLGTERLADRIRRLSEEGRHGDRHAA